MHIIKPTKGDGVGAEGWEGRRESMGSRPRWASAYPGLCSRGHSSLFPLGTVESGAKIAAPGWQVPWDTGVGWRLELILEGRAWRLKSTVAPSPTLVSTLYYWPSASVRKQMNLLPSFHQKGSSALTLRHGVCAPRLGSPDRRQAL